MAFFDELTRGIKATSQTVAQKTKEIGETVQIKSQMNAEKEAIARLYESVGRQVFALANEEAEQKFESEFAAIRSAKSKIAELESALADMDGCILCSVCGAKIDKTSRFCMKCGAPVEVHEKAETAEIIAVESAETEETIETEPSEVVEAEEPEVFESVENTKEENEA